MKHPGATREEYEKYVEAEMIRLEKKYMDGGDDSAKSSESEGASSGESPAKPKAVEEAVNPRAMMMVRPCAPGKLDIPTEVGMLRPPTPKQFRIATPQEESDDEFEILPMAVSQAGTERSVPQTIDLHININHNRLKPSEKRKQAILSDNGTTTTQASTRQFKLSEIRQWGESPPMKQSHLQPEE